MSAEPVTSKKVSLANRWCIVIALGLSALFWVLALGPAYARYEGYRKRLTQAECQLAEHTILHNTHWSNWSSAITPHLDLPQLRIGDADGNVTRQCSNTSICFEGLDDLPNTSINNMADRFRGQH